MPKFLPLESNPDMLTAYVRALGVQEPAGFLDIWSFDAGSLDLFPRPMLAVLVLYPSEAVDAARKEKVAAAALSADGLEGLVYVRQRMDTHGNACGSIAALHAVCNNADRLALAEGSPLLQFQRENAGRPAEQAADAMERASALHEATDAAARQGQTAAPDAEDEVDHHFIAFVRWNGRLVELDGLKPGPIDHGPCEEAELLDKAVAVIRDEMMPLANGNINFSAVGLVQDCPEMD